MLLFFPKHKQTKSVGLVTFWEGNKLLFNNFVYDFIFNIYSLFSHFTVVMYFDFYTDRFIKSINCLIFRLNNSTWISKLKIGRIGSDSAKNRKNWKWITPNLGVIAFDETPNILFEYIQSVHSSFWELYRISEVSIFFEVRYFWSSIVSQIAMWSKVSDPILQI